MRVRLLIGLLCGAITAFIQLYFRPAWREHSPLASALLGSLPNFLAVIGLSLIFLAFRKPTQRPNSVILAALLGILAHEVFTGSTPSNSFGGHFDWKDIVASGLGAIVAYLINQKLKRSDRETT